MLIKYTGHEIKGGTMQIEVMLIALIQGLMGAVDGLIAIGHNSLGILGTMATAPADIYSQIMGFISL